MNSRFIKGLRMPTTITRSPMGTTITMTPASLIWIRKQTSTGTTIPSYSTRRMLCLRLSVLGKNSIFKLNFVANYTNIYN